MPHKFQIFPDPLDARCTLHHDSGFVGTGTPNTDPSGRPGQFITIPDGVPDENGAELTVEKEGYIGMSVRGFLILRTDGVARLQVDDFNLVPADVVVDPPDPGTEQPNPNANPLDILNHVLNSGSFNLATASGCGLFMEAGCKELHEKMHPAWGHIKKNPGQNQFNGHAVDAIMLLVPSGGTAPGIYDCIQDSASPNAKLVFNYAGPVDNALWYYPAAPLGTKSLESVTVWHVGHRK
jgi:hypothetical protein